jgi:hypothetical protein
MKGHREHTPQIAAFAGRTSAGESRVVLGPAALRQASSITAALSLCFRDSKTAEAVFGEVAYSSRRTQALGPFSIDFDASLLPPSTPVDWQSRLGSQGNQVGNPETVQGKADIVIGSGPPAAACPSRPSSTIEAFIIQHNPRLRRAGP